jgi:hypothetical protein
MSGYQRLKMAPNSGLDHGVGHRAAMGRPHAPGTARLRRAGPVLVLCACATFVKPAELGFHIHHGSATYGHPPPHFAYAETTGVRAPDRGGPLLFFRLPQAGFLDLVEY